MCVLNVVKNYWMYSVCVILVIFIYSFRNIINSINELILTTLFNFYYH